MGSFTFNPNPNWKWVWIEKRKKISLDMANGYLIPMNYHWDKLVDANVIDKVQFDVDHSSLFYHFYQCISELTLEGCEKTLASLNAVLANRFYKLDEPSEDICYPFNVVTKRPKVGEVFTVVNPTRKNTPFDVMVVKDLTDLDDKCVLPSLSESRDIGTKSLCMVLGTGLVLGDKEYFLYDLVVFDNSKLIPFYKINSSLIEKISSL